LGGGNIDAGSDDHVSNNLGMARGLQVYVKRRGRIY